MERFFGPENQTCRLRMAHGGDFNVVKEGREINSSNRFRNSEAKSFSSLIDPSRLLDIPCNGKFSWFNGDGKSVSRLDRFFVDDSLIDKWELRCSISTLEVLSTIFWCGSKSTKKIGVSNISWLTIRALRTRTFFLLSKKSRGNLKSKEEVTLLLRRKSDYLRGALGSGTPMSLGESIWTLRMAALKSTWQTSYSLLATRNTL